MAHGEEMCGQLVYYYPFVASNGEAAGGLGANGEAAGGPGARMTRPHPSEDPNNTERHNDLFNIFFNTTTGL